MILREATVSFNRKIEKKATYNAKETQNPDNRNSGGYQPPFTNPTTLFSLTDQQAINNPSTIL